MKKLIKNLFLPLAVFAMLGLGALSLSASNVTNDVVTEVEAASMQDVYTGDFYVFDPSAPGSYRNLNLAEDEKPDHCTFEVRLGYECMISIGGTFVQVYGFNLGTNSIEPLYEI